MYIRSSTVKMEPRCDVAPVTPVLQLGWVGIDLIDSGVIILILCCIELSLLLVGVGCPNSNGSQGVTTILAVAATFLPTVACPFRIFCFVSPPNFDVTFVFYSASAVGVATPF
jgi:hypothetical protein